MTTHSDRRGRTRSPERLALMGFVAGAAITLPAVFLALLTPTGETLKPFLIPGALVLAPLSGSMAEWHGAVNLALTAAANGVVYAAAAVILGSLAALARRG